MQRGERPNERNAGSEQECTSKEVTHGVDFRNSFGERGTEVPWFLVIEWQSSEDLHPRLVGFLSNRRSA